MVKKGEASALVVDDEVTSKSLRQYAITSVIITSTIHGVYCYFLCVFFYLSEIQMKIFRWLKVTKYFKYFLTFNRRKILTKLMNDQYFTDKVSNYSGSVSIYHVIYWYQKLLDNLNV